MTHALRYAANCSMLFTELPLLHRPAAKAAGFDAIEIWWPFDKSVPADVEVDTFVTAVRDAGHRVATEASLSWLPRVRRAAADHPTNQKETAR